MENTPPSLPRLFAEMKRRKVFRVMAVYGVIGFGIIEAAEAIFPRVALPDWTVTLVVWLILLGFPIAVLLAWAFEQTPDGMKRTEDAAEEEIAEIVALPGIKRWLPGLLALAGVALLFGGGWWMGRQRTSLDSTVSELVADEAVPGIAVLPFAVRGLEEIWREGITEVLASNLEGLPGIRPISPMTVLARWGERATGTSEVDEATALEVARASGAHYAVISGSLTRAGDDTRIAAKVVDVATGSPIGQARADGTSADLMSLYDEFTVELARLVGAEAQAEYRAVDLRDATTESIEALRYYLAGSHQARRGDLPRAIALFDSAVAADSTFALALYGLGHSVDGEQDGVRSVPLLLDAQRMSTSPRLDLLIRGALAEIWSYGYAVPGMTRGAFLRTIDELRTAVRRNPEDPEMWNWLGEALWHGGAVPGLLPGGRDLGAEAFARASMIIPEINTGHLFAYSLRTGDSTLARQLMDRQADPERLLEYRLRYRLFFESMSETAAGKMLDSLRDVYRGGWYIFEVARDAPLPDRRATIYSWAKGTVRNLSFACAIGVATGRIEWVLERDWNDQSIALGCLLHLYNLSLPDAATIVAWSMKSQSNPWVTALYQADAGRPGALEQLARAHEDSVFRAATAGDTVGEQKHREHRQFASAYLAWRRGQADRAAGTLDSIPRPLELQAGHSGRHVMRPVAAKIYRDAGRLEDAAAQLEAQFTDSGMPQYLDELGRIYEELGDQANARRVYSLFLDRWQDADPVLQPRLEAARAALARLGPADQ